jgi:hypothetical protein
MPLPESLATIITTLGENFVPNSARREYVDNRDVWRLYLDLYELDKRKLELLIEAHADEATNKIAFRRKIGAVFNYVPTVIRMAINYIYSEAPIISVSDSRLAAFVSDCDGSGTPLAQYIRQSAFPLALVTGFVDVLVQNPATPDGMFVTAADDAAAAAQVNPRVLTITPLHRINWSTQPTHEYNWTVFVDTDNETTNPFVSGIRISANLAAAESEAGTVQAAGGEATAGALEFAGRSFVRLSRYLRLETDGGDDVLDLRDDDGRAVGFWVRSWQGLDDAGKPIWFHDGGWFPTARVPVATLYYARSIDPDRRHFGVSKIKEIAILTSKIIQLLSWTDEDVLANLALFVFPGQQPRDDNNNPIEYKLTPFGIIYAGKDAPFPPQMLQGETSHIKITMELIDSYIREILRLAYMIGASAEAEKITSGVQGVVARNELFMELSDLALAADGFTMDVLALAASWITNEDVTRAQLIERYKPVVNFKKSGYAVDPLSDIIANTNELLKVFEGLSPTMMRALYKQLAMSALSAEDESREVVFREIDAGFADMLRQREAAREAALATAGAITSGDAAEVGDIGTGGIGDAAGNTAGV